MRLLLTRRTACCPFLNAPTILTAPLEALLRHEGITTDTEAPEVSILLCDDAEIQELNREWRGKDKATDVLSFAQNDPDILGDIVVSLPTAQRQAQAADWPLENEVALLAVHGLLHLLGYDDETEAGARQMQEKTTAALKECGLALPASGAHPFFALK